MVVEQQPFRDQFAQVTDSGKPVPKDKKWHASTRENSQDKWKTDKKRGDTVGALEVQSEPSLDFDEPLKPLIGSENDKDLWQKAQTLLFGYQHRDKPIYMEVNSFVIVKKLSGSQHFSCCGDGGGGGRRSEISIKTKSQPSEVYVAGFSIVL